jgi:putative addiction module component (TIGR02574 family)
MTLNGGMKSCGYVWPVQYGIRKEGIHLVKEISDRIVETPEVWPLTDMQKEELNRRIAAYHQNPKEGSRGESVKEAIRWTEAKGRASGLNGGLSPSTNF